jgi:biofilm PGA synthesis protein PgaD
MRAADAVISRPANVPPLRRGFLGAVTLVAWAAFLWLLTPALPSLLDAVGLEKVYDTMGRVGPIDPVIAMEVFVVSVVAAGALLVWAEVQRRRFTGVERRSRAPDATFEQMAEALNCDPDTAERLRSGQVVRLTMRADGSPESAAVTPIPRPRRPVESIPAQRQTGTLSAEPVAVATGGN